MNTFISIQGVGLTRRGKSILKGIDLDISTGKTLAVLGPNGSGKSTLLELILADFSPSQGSIDYHFNRQKVFKSSIGVVYNNQHLFPQLYVKEILQFYQDLYRSDGKYMHQLVQQFDLEKLKKSFIRELSEGEKKKLAIVLALSHRPQFLVMDEPFSNVDVTIIESIWQEIRQTGATVIMATHDWNFAEAYADEILFLHEGEILCPKFSMDAKNTILEASQKLVTGKTAALLEKIEQSVYYEKDEQLNILLTPDTDLQAIRNTTFNYSIIDITIKDMFYYLSQNQRLLCSKIYS